MRIFPLAIVVFSLSAVSCRAPVQESGMSRLVIFCRTPGQSRTLLPAVDLGVASISVRGRGPGGAVFSLDSTGTETETSVLPGEWAVSADASNAQGLPVYHGECAIQVRPGIDCSASIILRPIDGEGRFGLDVVFPPGCPAQTLFKASITGENSSIDVERPLGSGPVDIPLASGYYDFRYSLAYPDGASCGGAECIRVLAGHTTQATLDFASIPGHPSLDMSIEERSPLATAVELSRIAVRGLPFFARSVCEAGQASTSWYLNGLPAGTGPAIEIGGTGLLPASFRLDALSREPASLSRGSSGALVTLADRADVDGWCQADFLNPQAPPGKGADQPVLICAWNQNRKLLALASESSSSSQLGCYGRKERDPAFERLGSSDLRIAGAKKRATLLRFSPDGGSLTALNRSSPWLALFKVGESGSLSQERGLVPADLSLPESSAFISMDFSPDGSRLYILEGGQRCVYAFSFAQIAERGTAAPLWALPGLTGSASSPPAVSDLKVSPAGAIFVRSESGDSVCIVDDLGGSGAIRQKMDRTALGPLMDGPSDMALSKDSSRLYIACAASGAVLALDADPSGMYRIASSVTSQSMAGLSGLRRMLLCPDGQGIVLPLQASGDLAFLSASGESLSPLGILPNAAESLCVATEADALGIDGGFILCGAKERKPADALSGAAIFMRKR
jgi:hypothetical protein